jgi:hypothetical protein
MDVNGVDEDFFALYGVKLLAGRMFIKEEHPN